MKKLLSVVLAVLMLAGCFSVASFAATVTLATGTNDGTITYNDDTVIIPSGVTYTNNGTIKLTRGALVVNAGGTLENYGTITVDDNTAVTVQGTYNNHIKLPAPFTVTYPASTPTFDRASHTITYTYHSLLESEMTAEDDYLRLDAYKTRQDIAVPYGDTLYIMITAEEGSKMVNYIDTSRIKLTNGGGGIVDSTYVDSSRRGIFVIKPVNGAEYSAVSTKYSDVVTQFVIDLPAKEGVYTIATDTEQTGSVLVNYGQMLTIHVILNEEYDESNPTLYIGGVEIAPDKYGYFDINTVYADDGKTLIVNSLNGTVSQDGQIITAYGVRAPFTITILGCVKNSTKQTFTNVLSYIKQIFEVFQEVFAELRAALSGLFN